MDNTTNEKRLLAFGFTEQEIPNVLNRLNDVAVGVAMPVDDLVYLYGTIKAQGVAYMTDIMQLSSRGIPVFHNIGGHLGISDQETLKRIKNNEIVFSEIEAAFDNMTNKGGLFHEMKKRYHEFTQRLAN